MSDTLMFHSYIENYTTDNCIKIASNRLGDEAIFELESMRNVKHITLFRFQTTESSPFEDRKRECLITQGGYKTAYFFTIELLI